MPIEKIRLKSGSEYPASPVYREAVREAVVPGVEMDYPFTYDPDAAGAGSISISLDVGGSTVMSENFVLLPLTERTFTNAELAALTAKGVADIFGTHLEATLEDPMLADVNTSLAMLVQQMGTIQMSAPFTGLPGMTATVMFGEIPLTLLSFSENDTGTTTSTVAVEAEGNPGTLTAQVTVPAAGSYTMIGVSSAMLEGVDIGGVISVCKWNFDSRFCGGVVRIGNPLFSWLTGIEDTSLHSSTVNLTAFPTVEQKLVDAWINSLPLAMVVGDGYEIASRSNGTYWYFHSGDLSYDPEDHTVTWFPNS